MGKNGSVDGSSDRDSVLGVRDRDDERSVRRSTFARFVEAESFFPGVILITCVILLGCGRDGPIKDIAIAMVGWFARGAVRRRTAGH